MDKERRTVTRREMFEYKTSPLSFLGKGGLAMFIPGA